MEEKTVKDIEHLGVSTASIVLLVDINNICGNKLRALWQQHDSAFNDSFESDSSKQIQFQWGKIYKNFVFIYLLIATFQPNTELNQNILLK